MSRSFQPAAIKTRRPRRCERWALHLIGRLIWRDARGVRRFANVETRDVSEEGVYLKCTGGDPIPLYRLVHLQLDLGEKPGATVPMALRERNVLSAVYRVDRPEPRTGVPAGYALRLLVEPDVLEMSAVEHRAARSIA